MKSPLRPTPGVLEGIDPPLCRDLRLPKQAKISRRLKGYMKAYRVKLRDNRSGQYSTVRCHRVVACWGTSYIGGGLG
jgi:hypothetical protein